MSEELKPEDTAKDFKLRHEEAIEKIKKLSPDERVKFVSKLWTQTTQKYIKDNPKWFAQRINNSFFLGIARLKDCIENPKDPQISWENPFIELRYPVEIEERETIQAFPKMEDPFTIETMTPWLSNFLLKELDITALRTLNKNYVVFIKNGERAVILPKKLEARLSKLSKEVSKEEAQKKLDKMKFKKDFLFSSYGKAKENGKETPFKIILKFSVKPLTIVFNPNDEVLEAYLPMEVGLEYRRGNPAKWSKEDKKYFWIECLKAFNEANKLLEKDQEPVKEEREPEVRPISEDREALIVGRHLIKEGILGKAKEYLPLEEIWDENIKKQAQESGVKILGLDPSWRGLKAIIATYSLLNKIKYEASSKVKFIEEAKITYTDEGKEEIKIIKKPVKEEVDEKVDEKVKALRKEFGYNGSIPIIEETPDEYYLACGIKPQSSPRGWNETPNYQKTEAIDALIESGTRAFVWSYERLKRDPKTGKPIFDTEGKPIKELVEAYRPFQLVDLIKDPQTGEILKIRIIPTPIFFDEIKSHYMAYPKSLLDDVYKASGKRGKGRPPTYQFLFILWLLLRVNEDRNGKGIAIGNPERKSFGELANILKMTSYLKGRKTKQLREVMLPKCFDIAKKLGYLADVKEDKEGYIFRINPEKFKLKTPFIPLLNQ